MAAVRSPRCVSLSQALAEYDHYDAVLDARSPGEFALDHLPSATSAPVLSDQERARVGTLYQQEGAFEAKRIGAALVSRNIADLLDGSLATVGRHWRPLIYCWRGGNRSGALATVLSRIGWQASILEGGYRAFRRQVLLDLTDLRPGLRFVVLAGSTGSGKTLMLQALAQRGAQVLDLEALASHRGSVLGRLPEIEQPPQKRFDSLLWQRLRQFDPERPIFVESESRKVGSCQVPESLILAMRASACVVLETSDPVRIQLLLDEYRHFLVQPELLIERLASLLPLYGHERLNCWRGLIEAGQWHEFVARLLQDHYDPVYEKSMRRNFTRLAAAARVNLQGLDAASIDAAAIELITLAD